MVLSKKDRVLIEQLHPFKGYGAKKLVKEFPEKKWQVCSMRRLLKKLGKLAQPAVKRAVEDHEVRGHKRILTLSATLSSVRKMPLALITLCVTYSQRNGNA